MKQYEQVTKYKKVFKEAEEVEITDVKKKLEELNASFQEEISNLMIWFDSEAAGFAADGSKDLKLIIKNFDKIFDTLNENEKLIEKIK